MECAKGVELFHHEALDGELLDDGFFDASLGSHTVDVEMNAQLVFVFQVGDDSVGCNGQLLVIGIYLDVAEGHAVVIAAEPYAEVQGQRELTEYGGEGPGDIL